MWKLFPRKGQKVSKENYRPIRILTFVSKILEKVFFSKQLTTFFENVLSKHQCRVRKGHDTQDCLLLMLGKWKKALDNKVAFWSIINWSFKGFACLNHELLIAKLHAYGLSLSSLELVHDYLLNRKQRSKVNSKYSSWADILEGVPHGSILGSLLFNIFLCDLFIIIGKTYFAKYVVDNTPYVIKKTVTEVLHELETVSKKLFMWFTKNEIWLMLTNAIFFSALLKITQLKSKDLLLKIHTVKNF